ncbi:type I DNA topoisomerase [Geminicoccaceae bacterium 1502E]|nr:type I DNA topoisomerase [Geminicoccaceae bacterium 1502E]
MDVVVVESPTKAKAINKYLGEGFKVLSSYGHVRDLPEKDGSVRPSEDFHIIYEPLEEKKKRIDDIARALKGAERLWLATDPDREGEAISWHLLSVLKEKKAVSDIEVKRVVFHEVTKRAVLEAMRHPRDLDLHLIDAYQARRALDYLVGFTLSPVLWRKLQGSRSAGRVQSVALRLISEREAEIEAFVAREYWTVEAALRTGRNERFTARLTHLDGKRLDKFALPDEEAAGKAVAAIQERELAVSEVERKQVSRSPAPPFSTSTMQQEAARKLGFSADRTMKVAQRLFEGIDLGGETVGLITYMRTDSVSLSSDALSATRELVRARFGADYLPDQPRRYKNRAKNAQEAHEAIRPTDPFRTPQDVGRFLDDDQRRLYELVWKRTVACQMAAALLDRVVVDIASPDAAVGLRATGQTVAFDGFLKLYQEGRDDRSADDDDGDEDGRLLPQLAAGDALGKDEVKSAQHFTEPPPRFSEASLVKRMEELGIGRPSTYASIISVLQGRHYVRLENKRFVPEDRGRLVSAFLVAFFDRYVQPGFTADLEGKLDDVAAGEKDWKTVLREFWEPFAESVDGVKERRVAEVIDALNEALAARLFPPRADGGDPRACPLCENGSLSLKLGRYGAFVGCSNYPECRFTRRLGEEGGDKAAGGDRLLGSDPASGEEVWLKIGRFGPYVQRGAGAEAKRSSLPKNLPPEEVDLEKALALLALPREVGTDPESGKPVTAGINRFGPFVHLDGRFVRLDADEDVLAVGLNRALDLLSRPVAERRRQAAAPLRELGAHPEDGEPVRLFAGRYGPYVKHGAINASLPKGREAESLTMEEAVELLRARAEKDGGKKKPKRPAAKKPAKAPAKKAATTKKASASGDEAAPVKAATKAPKKPAAKKPPARKAAAGAGEEPAPAPRRRKAEAGG